MTEPSSFSNVPWPVRPSPGINYDFVAMMYLAGSGIAMFFYLLEKQILAPLLEDDNQNVNNTSSGTNEVGDGGEGGDSEEGPWKEFAKGMEGMHFIFLPFIPCLFWSLVVRYYWLKETKVSQEKKEK